MMQITTDDALRHGNNGHLPPGRDKHGYTYAMLNAKQPLHKRVRSLSRVTKTHLVARICVSLGLSQTPVYTARPPIRRYSSRITRCACLFPRLSFRRHLMHPRRNGPCELTLVAGYIPRWLSLLVYPS